jgi:hypothetical protein
MQLPCYTLAALVCLGTSAFSLSPEARGMPPAQVPLADSLFDPTHVSKIEIEIEESDWDRLRIQKRDFAEAFIEPSAKPFDYFKGNITIDGLLIRDVAIRKKGFFGSLDDDAPSLRVKLDEYVDQAPLGAVKRLTLNNNKQDPALASQYLSYRLFNQAGVPASRVGFAEVLVNSVSLGVYSCVESVDKSFLKDRFGSSKGDLLEGTISDLSPKSVARFEWKSGASETPADWHIMKLAELLSISDTKIDEVAKHLDVEAFYRFWAVESLIGFWDGYCGNQNNFFVYDDSARGLVFMPWGADSAWMNTASPFAGFGGNAPNSVYATSLLPHRLFNAAGGAERYRQTLQQILDKFWNEDELYSEIDRVSELLRPYLHKRQLSAAASQKAMKRFIQTRRKRIEREFEKWPVKVGDKPRSGMYAVDVGFARGVFNTYWERNPKGSEGKLSAQLQLDGKEVALLSTSVGAKRSALPFGFGPQADAAPVVIEFAGKDSNGESYMLSLTLDPTEFRVGETHVSGSLTVGQPSAPSGPFGSPNARWLMGRCALDEASSKRGEPIVGSFDLHVLQIKGGFFGP